MKRIIIFALFFPALPLFATKILIGHKTGSVEKVGMQGLRPGDTLVIRAGDYMQGGEFRDLRDITIINDQGIVRFGAGLVIGSLTGVTITGAGDSALRYGLRFSNLEGDAITVDAPCSGLRIFNCQYDSVRGNIMSVYKLFTTYTGADSTLALFKTVIANQRLVHSGTLLTGSFDVVGSFHNVIDSISFYNIIIDTTLNDGNEVSGNSIYRMSAHDWIIRGGTPYGEHDVGVFMTHGNGSVFNIYRTGGWGYLWRLWNVGLNGRGESYLYNCIDLGTANYGTIDTRIDPDDTTTGREKPFLRGGNMHVLNNTSGNKKDVVDYVSVLVVAGNFFPQNGYTLEIRNNLSFHNIIRNTSGIVMINTDHPVTDTSNNLYVEDPIASGVLSDTVLRQIRPGSPSREKVQFADPSIIGARELPANDRDQWRSSVFLAGIRMRFLLIPAGVLASALLFLLIFNRRTRKKKTQGADARHSYPPTH
jgi:hypothetical protein